MPQHFGRKRLVGVFHQDMGMPVFLEELQPDKRIRSGSVFPGVLQQVGNDLQ
jgi:hypothetical protein